MTTVAQQATQMAFTSSHLPWAPTSIENLTCLKVANGGHIQVSGQFPS